MARFRFSLEKVLEVKRRVEEDRQALLGEAMARVDAEQERMRALQGSLEALRQDLAASLEQEILDIWHIENCRKYELKLRNDILNQARAIARAQAAAEERRLELLEAVRDRKVLEKLEEKEREKFFKEGLAREQAILDEMALRRRGDA